MSKVGHRCSVCNGVFDSMLDDKCNNCREREKETKALVKEIQRLTKIIDRVIEK